MNWDAVLVPFGILEQARGDQDIAQPFLVFGQSRETADFIADAIELWWEERQAEHPGVNRIQIELDNGPEIASSRTQFMRRLIEFSDRHQVEISLVYFPPYHSKYNPIERVWGILEQHWNGTVLNSIEKVLNWAATFTWKGNLPLVRRIEEIYHTGVTLARVAYRPFAQRLKRDDTIKKWSVTISPQ